MINVLCFFSKMPVINVETNDKELFKVDTEVAKCSKLIRNMLEDLGSENDEDSEPIILEQVSGPTFRKVIEWCEHHKGDPDVEDDDEVESSYLKEQLIVPEWDEKFLEVSHGFYKNF